jgi:transposase, IS5 family
VVADKVRAGWGYETLVREVSDSLHLREFCRIALVDRVPDESTVRKLVRRLGAEVVEEIVMAVIARASEHGGERRFVARAARIDSTVVESDIRYPTDLGLAHDAARMLAIEAKQAAELAGRERRGCVTALGRSPSGYASSTGRSLPGPDKARRPR